MKDKNKEIETTQESNTEQEVLYQQFLEMPLDNLEDIYYDKMEFQNGINKSSEIAGFITGLVNCGMSFENAMEIYINESTIKHNLNLAKENNATSIEIAKITEVKQNVNMI